MTATPQSNATLEDIARELSARDNFVICGHVSPDGDCLGSQLALAAALRRLGKNVSCVLAKRESPDEALSFLPGFDQLVPAADFDGDCDVFVAVDAPTVERIGDAAALHDGAPYTITIDHHAVDDRMADASYTDPDSASTTMLVWKVCDLLGVDRSGDVAICAYTGLMTDTGGFRYQNADADSFLAASEMVAAGADPVAAANGAFQNRTIASYRLEGVALDHAAFLCGGSIVVSWISASDMEAAGAVKADAESVIVMLRSIRGVAVACVLREQDDGVRGSIRSKDGTDVARIARLYGGGGHLAAAGFTMEGPIDRAFSEMKQVLVREIGDVS